MSKMESIVGSEAVEVRFQENSDRLNAVESVVYIISEMANIDAQSSLILPPKEALQDFYLTGSAMVQRRVDSICADLTNMAHSGGQALLQFKAEGRENLGAAASCLIREISQTSAQIMILMRK